MACKDKNITGKCNHVQCRFSDKTEHGYECIDLISRDVIEYSKTVPDGKIPDYLLGKCEVGGNCLPECGFSWFDPDHAEWEFDGRSNTYICGTQSNGIGVFRDDSFEYEANIVINGTIFMCGKLSKNLVESKKQVIAEYKKRIKKF